jgi:hypothetical protein
MAEHSSATLCCASACPKIDSAPAPPAGGRTRPFYLPHGRRGDRRRANERNGLPLLHDPRPAQRSRRQQRDAQGRAEAVELRHPASTKISRRPIRRQSSGAATPVWCYVEKPCRQARATIWRCAKATRSASSTASPTTAWTAPGRSSCKRNKIGRLEIDRGATMPPSLQSPISISTHRSTSRPPSPTGCC